MMQARTLTEALGGRWYGQYGLTFCPAHHNTRTPALSLSHGTDGRLLAHCKAGCAFTDIIEALKWSGLLEGAERMPVPGPKEQARFAEAERTLSEKKARQARDVWQSTEPIEGTLAETYLRRRGISSSLPDTLRFHPQCWHGPTARRYPAMLALIENGETFAIHRTYLGEDGRKAAIDPSKMMLGGAKGGAVRLKRGAGLLAVAEGIETALSFQSVISHPGTLLAALSTSGLVSLNLPEIPGEVIIAVDGDDAGREAGRSLASRAIASRWQVRIADPGDGLDFNDLLEREVSA